MEHAVVEPLPGPDGIASKTISLSSEHGGFLSSPRQALSPFNFLECEVTAEE
jgi:hypothetical protein